VSWNLTGSYVETCSCELMCPCNLSLDHGATYDFCRVTFPFGVENGQPVRFNGMFHPVGSDLTMAEAKRSQIDAFGIQYEGKTGLSKSEFSWAA
jgi:hypothetical protein